MPDIRKNPNVIDPFSAYSAGDLLDGIDVPSDWAQSDTGRWWPLEVTPSATVTHKAGNTTSMSSYVGPGASAAMDGDQAECWSLAVGGGVVSGVAWAIGLMTDVGGSFTVNGYRWRWEIPGPPWAMYRYDNGSQTQIGTSSTSHGIQDRYCLIRRNGSDVEGWVSDADFDASSWTLVISVTDTNHMTGLYGSLGCTDNGSGQILGWDDFGAGVEPVWHPEFLRRPWEYQGRQLAL